MFGKRGLEIKSPTGCGQVYLARYVNLDLQHTVHPREFDLTASSSLVSSLHRCCEPGCAWQVSWETKSARAVVNCHLPIGYLGVTRVR